MGVEQQIWRIDESDVPTKLATGGMDFEKRLENVLEANIDLVSPAWLVIGRQCDTPWGKHLDLLRHRRLRRLGRSGVEAQPNST